MNNIVIKNIEPQSIKISGAGEVIGITAVYVNGVNVTEGSVAYVIVPTKTSELENNSGFITEETDPTIPYYIKQIRLADITRWNNKQDELVSGVNIKTINSNSLLGSGNIDISTSYTAGTGIEITEENVINNTITSYDDLDNLPTIPTKISDLTNDSDFVESTSLAEVAFNGSYLALSNTPDSTSDFTNDGENGVDPFITNKTNSLENYYNIDYMWKILPHVTDSDTNINLSPTVSDTTLKISLNPSTLSQDGTPTPSSPQDIHTISGSNKVVVCGKNLFDEWISGTVNTTTGEITSVARNRSDYIEVQPNTQYSMWRADTGFATYMIEYNSSKAFIQEQHLASATTSGSFTTNANTNYVILFQYTSYAPTNKLMFNKGTATDYEPYVSQEADIDMPPTSKQLFNKNNMTLSSYITTGGTVITPNTYYDISNWIGVIPNEKYTYQGLILVGSDAVLSAYYDKNKNFISTFKQAIGTNTITIPNNVYYVRFSINKQTNDKDTFMIEKGETASTYEAYSTIEYCKIGTYSDRIFKNISSDPDYSSERDEGAWYIKKNIGKDKLTSDNVIYHGVDNYRYQYKLTPSQNTIKNETILSNYFYDYGNTNWWTYDGNVIINNATVIYLTTTLYTSITAFNNFTSANDVYVYYPLATPTYTQITGTLAEQLDTIEDGLKAYNEQTNISQVNADLPFVINADTLKSLANL